MSIPIPAPTPDRSVPCSGTGRGTAGCGGQGRRVPVGPAGDVLACGICDGPHLFDSTPPRKEL